MSLGTVSELWRYPVKSMAGQQITDLVNCDLACDRFESSVVAALE
jgi:uncharacterized protein YcbX